jgi:hypothetical protein
MPRLEKLGLHSKQAMADTCGNLPHARGALFYCKPGPSKCSAQVRGEEGTLEKNMGVQVLVHMAGLCLDF